MLHTFRLNLHLLTAFNNQEVEYLLVGGLAVKYYCPEKTSGRFGFAN